MTDLNDIDRMTYLDIRLRKKAADLRDLDKEREISFLAWQMREVSAKRKRGKKSEYIYTRFDKFFDFAKKERKLTDVNVVPSVADNYKEYLKKKKNG